MTDQPSRLLIIGTGGMAAPHAGNFARISGVTVVAGVDTRPEQLATFCETHGIEHRFTSLAEALAWGDFDAVANVTPDAAHYATTLPVIAAAKHILCEKPLATKYAHAQAMADAAAAAGVVNMVNLTYRNGPAMQQAAVLVAEGAIGAVRHFEASYLQSWLTQPAWGDWKTEHQWLWRLSSAHGSKGVLGDVGIHIIDYATFVAGSDPVEVSAALSTFDKAPGGRIGDYVLDANDSATLQLRLANGTLGVISATRFATGHINDLRLRIYGDRGGLEVQFENNVSRLMGCLGDATLTGKWSEIACQGVPTIYQRFIEAIRGNGPAIPDFARGAALQKVLDLAEVSAKAGSAAQRLI